jgi:hypothetical protein
MYLTSGNEFVYTENEEGHPKIGNMKVNEFWRGKGDETHLSQKNEELKQIVRTLSVDDI